MVRASIFKGKTNFILRLARVSRTHELEDVLLQWESTQCLATTISSLVLTDKYPGL